MSIFGVVPVLIMQWNPEIAPQAMVIKMYGITGPVITGPPPEINCVTAGIWMVGITMIIPRAKAPIVPIFMYVDK